MIKEYLNLGLFVILVGACFTSEFLILDIRKECEEASSDSKIYSEISGLIDKNRDYLLLHNDLIFNCSCSEIKSELEKISLISDLENISFHEEKRLMNSLCLDIKIKSNLDKNIYKFLYLVENILGGIVSIDSWKIEDCSGIFFCELGITINLFNSNLLKLKKNVYSSNDLENTLKRIDDLCDFSLFRKEVLENHKLCGIINCSAFINNILFREGDSIDGFYIEKILPNKVVIKTPTNELKDIALGERF